MKLLSRAILDKDEKQIARQLNIVMSRMISILDTKAPDAMKEFLSWLTSWSASRQQSGLAYQVES